LLDYFSRRVIQPGFAEIGAGREDDFAVLQRGLYPYLRPFWAESLDIEVSAVGAFNGVETCIARNNHE
jgi:hypothetical protein